MKTIPFDARRANLTYFRGATLETCCHTCCDTAFVVVYQRPAEKLSLRPGCVPQGAYEELGPCPFCQAGYTVEFPAPMEGNRGGPWGADGFWRGRDADGLEPLRRPGSKPLPIGENRRRWREEIGPLFGKVANPLLEDEAA